MEAENEIVELNNSIAIETKKADENKKKCDDIEKKRVEQKLDHLEKMKYVNERFEKTRIQFHSELKIISKLYNIYIRICQIIIEESETNLAE